MEGDGGSKAATADAAEADGNIASSAEITALEGDVLLAHSRQHQEA